jgi:hypothetical protein
LRLVVGLLCLVLRAFTGGDSAKDDAPPRATPGTDVHYSISTRTVRNDGSAAPCSRAPSEVSSRR